MNFGGAYYKINACFEQKMAFLMQNFFTSLPDFTRFKPLCVQIRSPVFSVGD